MRCLLFLVLSVAACGSGELVPEEDAGTDASIKPDASNDTSVVDSKPNDTGSDTGSDAQADAEQDAEVDAESDGGIIDAAMDAGGMDSSVLCGKKTGLGFMGMGQCGKAEQYKCGNDTYEIDCQCPAASCACKKNFQNVNTVNNVSGCPQCSFNFASIAVSCGFPY